MEVYYQQEEGYRKQTVYSQDFEHERKQSLPNAKLTAELQTMQGFQFLREKATICCKHPLFKLLVVYANRLGNDGVEILRRGV